ncbi:uncharacterized protein LOC132196153 [Neocloeon triangulifer]|uniref:uncharacterized protein LOC132196153 n=1 Tax=Neocloeon triangulifer TaxID=2078957 RepID=UPI00286F0F3D|nr:uncharacterized protein LOC132196153 [Neocloeon triangulifer]
MRRTHVFWFLCVAILVLIGQGSGTNSKPRKKFRKPLSLISPNDMRGPDGQISSLYTEVSPKLKWPNGVVYWEYDSASTFTDAQKAIITKGMQQIQSVTCIKFVARTSETAYISIQNTASGCWATAGYQGTKQALNLASDCYADTSTFIHEVMHSFGFQHEQTRYDRDIYVEVQWENIMTGMEGNFAKYPRTKAYPRYDYDFNSVMQYTLDGFGIGGRPSMILTFKNSSLNENEIGKATKMSTSDVLRMQSAYKCNSNGEGSGKSRALSWEKESKFANQPYGELLPLSKIQGAQACKATAAMMNWVNTYQLNNLQSKDIKNFIDDKSKSYLSTICTPATVVNCIFGANDFVNSSGSINIQNLKAFLSTNAPNTTWGNIMNTILDPMNSDYNTAYQFTDIVEDNFEKVVCPTGNVNLLPIIMMQMLQSEIIWMCPKQAVYDTTIKNKSVEGDVVYKSSGASFYSELVIRSHLTMGKTSLLIVFLLFAEAVFGKSYLQHFKLPFSPYDNRAPPGKKVSGQYTIVSPKLKWPNGIVYWEYDSANNFTDAEKAIIQKGFGEIQNATCMKFVAKTSETAYVNIKNNEEGCWATGNYQGTKQDLNLASGCFGDTSTIIHEMMHAMGFDHEQNRYDRDMYVEVQWENIEKGKENNFDKQPRTKAYPRFQYDFNSLMQYFLTGFGIGGRPTLVLVNPMPEEITNKIGNAVNMSTTDILRMRGAYRCDANGENSGLGRVFLGEESNFAKHNFF